jgi:hypothetical protein
MEMHSQRVNEYGGDWIQASPEVCQIAVCMEHSSLGNLTWHTDPPFKLFTKQTACERVHDLGYNRIFLVGDSFIRHTYQSLLLIFSDDYEYGALNRVIPQCKGDSQFSEKGCSRENQFSNPIRSVCNDTIKLAFYDVFKFKLTPERAFYKDPESAVVWSEGSHPALFNYSAGGRNVSHHKPHHLVVESRSVALIACFSS